MKQSIDTRNKSAGFTLIEIGIIVPILIVMVLIIFDALMSMIRASTIEAGKVNITYDRQIAMSNIESDLVLASVYLPEADPDYPDPYDPNGGWSYEGTGEDSRVLVARMYATTLNPLDPNRRPAFQDDNDPAGVACQPTNIFSNPVQEYNVIYFIDNGNLLRRRIINTSNTLCSPGQYQKLSCPSQERLDELGLGGRDSSCSADDELIASNVSAFTVKYYGSKTSTTPLPVYSGGTAEDRAELVTTAADAEITLTLSKKVGGNTVSSTSTLRFSKLNAPVEE